MKQRSFLATAAGCLLGFILVTPAGAAQQDIVKSINYAPIEQTIIHPVDKISGNYLSYFGMGDGGSSRRKDGIDRIDSGDIITAKHYTPPAPFGSDHGRGRIDDSNSSTLKSLPDNNEGRPRLSAA